MKKLVFADYAKNMSQFTLNLPLLEKFFSQKLKFPLFQLKMSSGWYRWKIPILLGVLGLIHAMNSR